MGRRQSLVARPGAVCDGAWDLPRVLGLLLLPGALVVVGGLLVLALLVGFWLLEVVVFGAVAPLRKLDAVGRRTKPANRPTILWSS